MELPFKIPIQINDLLKPCHDQFYVRNTYTIDEIPDKLQGKFSLFTIYRFKTAAAGLPVVILKTSKRCFTFTCLFHKEF